MVLWPKLLSEQHHQGSQPRHYDPAIPISSEKDPAQYGKFMYFPFDSIDIPTALDIPSPQWDILPEINQTGSLLIENPLKVDSDWECNSCSDRKPYYPFIFYILKRS